MSFITPLPCDEESGAGTGGLTDEELRATPVPVTGTVTANLGTIDGAATETTLAAILTELGQKIEPGGEVALNAATLAALENITVTLSNPTADPETGLAKEVTLAAILTELGQKLEPGGEVALNAATLAALENITVTVSGVVPVSGTFWQAVQPVSGPLTDVELRASPISTNVLNDTAVNKFATGVRTTRAFLINTSGDNIIIVPATGTKLRVYWVGYSSSESNTAEVLTQLRFGSGPTIYGWYMGAPGAFMHWEPIEGAVDEALIINLTGSQSIQVNVTYQEI